jgi:hypothetical protein
MTKRKRSREVRKAPPPPPLPGKRNWIIHLVDKAFDTITAAGPVGWICIVAIAGMTGMAFIVYMMSGHSTGTH